jgi:hypothetical protein
MGTKKNLIFGMVFVFGIFLISGIYAAETSFCCERSTSGAWCQDLPENQCDTSNDLKVQPTACESTSYCSVGTCIDTTEGICMPNTPKRLCNEKGGIWKEGTPDKNKECDLGCCLIGNQAAFVTGVRCNKLSTLYGLNIIFRQDIKDETACIESARSDAMGACVFTKDFVPTCKMLTKKDCDALSEKDAKSFHEGLLCTNKNLNTNCNPTSKRTCVKDKDEVYFLDSCGNVANIYMQENAPLPNNDMATNAYWQKIYLKSETICNANEAGCGKCDYYEGSTCREEKKDNAKCVSLSCNFEGQEYRHGETWCAVSNPTVSKDKGVSNIKVNDAGEMLYEFSNANVDTQNLPGSRYFRMVCYNNEVTVEPCADFRQEICIESSIDNAKTQTDGFNRPYLTAACRANRWQDCVIQPNQDDCENGDRRDCVWKGDGKIHCMPKFAPGLQFWVDDATNSSVTGKGTEAEQFCSLPTETCTAKYVEKLWTMGDAQLKGKSDYCFDNDGNFQNNWVEMKRLETKMMGDCGYKVNYIGKEGYLQQTKQEDYKVSTKSKSGMGF